MIEKIKIDFMKLFLIIVFLAILSFTLNSVPATLLHLNSSYDMADVYAENSTDNFLTFQIKWNISEIPQGAEIQEAILCLYWTDALGTPNNFSQYWRVDDQTWDELITNNTWNSQNLTNNTLENWTSVTVNTTGCLNITPVILTDYNLGNNFSSIRIEDPDFHVEIANIIIDDNGLRFGSTVFPLDALAGEDRENSQLSGNLPYLNITYSIDNAPIVALNSPLNNTNLSSQAIVFNCSASDDVNLANITLWGNFNGTWQANETHSVTGTENSTTFSLTLGEGSYVWNCKAYDNSSQGSFASQNFTLTIDTTEPIVSLISPVNNSVENSTVVFNYNVTDNVSSITNCSLWLNDNIVNTSFSVQKNVIQNFTQDLYNGNYTWKVSCINQVGLQGNSSTYSLMVNDTTIPSVTLISPSDGFTTKNQAIVFNCSASDDVNLANITLWGNFNGTWQANETHSVTGTENSTTFSLTLGEGSYVWNCKAYDNSSQGSFASQNFTLTIDLTAPLITFIGPNGTQSSPVLLNVTTNENSSCKYDVNDASYLNMTGTMNGNTTTHTASLNLESGTYTYYVKCNDTVGNVMAYSNSTTFTVYNQPPGSIGSIGSSGGGGGGSSSTKKITPKFSVDKKSINLTAFTKEFKEVKFVVTNNANGTIKFSIISNADFMIIQEKSFSLNIKENKLITLKVYSPEEPGVYKANVIVKSGTVKKTIPLILNVIPSKSIDINVNIFPEYKKVLPLSNVKTKIKLKIKEILDRKAVLVFKIKNSDGNYLMTEEETIPVNETIEKEIIKEFSAPKSYGPYVLEVELNYADLTFLSKDNFNVIRPIETPRKFELTKLTKIFGIILIALILIFIIFAIINKKEKIEKISNIHEIHELLEESKEELAKRNFDKAIKIYNKIARKFNESSEELSKEQKEETKSKILSLYETLKKIRDKI